MTEERELRVQTSESGRYVLRVTSIPRSAGGWSHTLGIVQQGERVIARVTRNYSAFPFLCVEQHRNGHDYLVCGEDYQGQTVIELDTGRRRDFLPEEAAKGHGFCWAAYTFDREREVLVVDGCYWACPYEYRFHDFSDPMEKGWPEIEIEGDYVESGGMPPTFGADGTITTYETRSRGELAGKSYAQWVDSDRDLVVVATRRFARVAQKLVQVASWVDDEEQERRAAELAAREAREKAWQEYQKSDPIFLFLMERASRPPFENEPHTLSTGVCHDAWHPTEKFDDARVCKRLLQRSRDEHGRAVATGWTVDVEWGRKLAPIKLTIYRDGDELETTWYERSLAGMARALDHAANVVTRS